MLWSLVEVEVVSLVVVVLVDIEQEVFQVLQMDLTQ
jgi:hypothetical protein